MLYLGKSTLDQLERIVSWTGMPCKEDIDSLENSDVDHLLKQVTVSTDYKKKVIELIPEEFQDLLSSLLHFNPNKRPRVQDCLSLPIF